MHNGRARNSFKAVKGIVRQSRLNNHRKVSFVWNRRFVRNCTNRSSRQIRDKPIGSGNGPSRHIVPRASLVTNVVKRTWPSSRHATRFMGTRP